MVKFLKPNKVVIILQGKYVARKVVIVSSFDEETRDRPYGHCWPVPCLVACVSKYQKNVIGKDSAKKQAKKSCVKASIKLVNYNHIIPTCYTLDVDLKDVVNTDVLRARDKKVTAMKENKARLEERFKTGKNHRFFTR
ncbi:60S ribosomal protein L27-like [Solanum verrucosum]|uniref:60S ribosomal protein L27-like n=1 Tax=Solanum verrucosum TaxID=315347 RepID=UPI0020D1A46B|nr:60S ribosomal protein L27-like [Solanum verrucosum]